MYFSDLYRVKRNGDFIVISFRVNEKKVEEHKILVEKVDKTMNEVGGDGWCGATVFQIKKSERGFLLKFHTNVYRADIYCLSNAEFRMLKSLYLSIRGF